MIEFHAHDLTWQVVAFMTFIRYQYLYKNIKLSEDATLGISTLLEAVYIL